LVTELEPEHPVKAVAIRKPPFPELPASIATVHASYQLQCSADGMMYQLAICDAAKRLGLDVQLSSRGEEAALAAKALGVSVTDIEKFVSDSGRPEGPPWTLEHRRAYAASIAELSRHVGRLRID
jgi:sugar phosphate isomerase/epimerase